MGKRADRRAFRDHLKLIGDVAAKVRDKIPGTRRLVVFDGLDQTTHGTEQTLVIRTNPVTWGFPMDEIVFSRWVMNLYAFRIMPWEPVLTSLSTYIPEARNLIHEQFVLDVKTSNYLVMLDSDVLPPDDFLERLLQHIERDPKIHVVGGWYKRKNQGEIEPVVYHLIDPNMGNSGWKMYTPDEIPRDAEGKPHGLEAVDGAGAGCWLMTREAAEAIGPKPYNMNEGGEDLLLCKKLHAKGYKTWIDWSIECAHMGVGFY